jgi:hypothetical protein
MANDSRNLLENVEYLGVSNSNKAGNLNIGSQLGVGVQIPHLDAATPLVFPPTVIVVLQTPVMYDTNPEIGRMIKSIMESHAKTVSGIDFGYTLETQDTPVGHDGQTMAVPTKTKRSQVNPTFTFQEVTGNLIWNLFRQWIWDIQHPDTNASMVGNADTNQAYRSLTAPASPYSFTMTTYALSMLAIQFDPTMLPQNIIDAAFYTNMFPTATGEIGFERTISTSKTMERSISFQAIVQHNNYVRRLAREVAEKMNLRKVKYEFAPSAPGEGNAPLKNIVDSGLQREADGAISSWV